MNKITIRTDGKMLRSTKQLIVIICITMTIMPQLIYNSLSEIVSINKSMLDIVSYTGLCLLLYFLVATYLLSRYSPIVELKLRRNIIRFTRMFMRQEDDSIGKYSVVWDIKVSKGIKKVILVSRGLVENPEKTVNQLVEFLGENILEVVYGADEVVLNFGPKPCRYNGEDIINDDFL